MHRAFLSEEVCGRPALMWPAQEHLRKGEDRSLLLPPSPSVQWLLERACDRPCSSQSMREMPQVMRGQAAVGSPSCCKAPDVHLNSRAPSTQGQEGTA